MGVALYKADFLYPKHQPPLVPRSHDPDDDDTPPLSAMSQPAEACNFFCPENYQDYSDLAQFMPKDSLLLNPPKPPSSPHQLNRKVVFLPTQQQGPVLLYLPRQQSHPSILTGPSETPKMPSIGQNMAQKPEHTLAKQETPSEEVSKECETVLQETEKLVGKGQLQKALELLVAARKQNKWTAFEQAKLAEVRGDIGKAKGDSDLAIEEYETSADLYDQVYGLSAATVLCKAAAVRVETKQLVEASRCLDSALELRQERLGQDDPLLGQTLTALAEVEVSTGNFERGSELYGAAIHVYKQSYGYDHVDIAEAYWHLAAALWQIGQFKMWIDYHHECLRMLARLELKQVKLYHNALSDLKKKTEEVLGEGRDGSETMKAVGVVSVLLRGEERRKWVSGIQKYKLPS